MPEINGVIVRAALSNESNDGWIWLQTSAKHFSHRTVVGIRQRDRCCWNSIWVEARIIDHNFRKQYNSTSKHIPICQTHDTIVMAEWYREALGISRTTHKDNKTDTANLIIETSKVSCWGSLRAAGHHPDINVRLAARLGVLGVWLGIIGVYLGLVGTDLMKYIPYLEEYIGPALIVFIAIIGILSVRSPPRSSKAK